MKKTVNRLVFWTPRILCIVFAGFVSLFALDVFSEGYGFWETVIALLIHLVPTAIILVVLVVSWRREWVGAIAFNALAVLYIVMSRGQFNWSIYVIMSGPLSFVGFLFLLNLLYSKQLRAGS